MAVYQLFPSYNCTSLLVWTKAYCHKRKTFITEEETAISRTLLQILEKSVEVLRLTSHVREGGISLPVADVLLSKSQVPRVLNHC